MKLPHLIFQRKPHQSALPTITTDQRGMVRMLTGDESTTDDELWFGANDAATLEWRKLAVVEDVSAEIDGDVATHAALTATHGATGAIVGTTNSQTLTNKTLTTPTIGDLTNAQHTHANAAGGGTVAHTALTSIGTNTHAQIDTHIAATAAHGATGAVVGTTNTQTLSGKTLTAPVIADFSSANHTHDNAAGGGFVPYYYATFGPFFTNDVAASATVALEAAFFDTATTVSRSTPDLYMPVAGEILGIWVISDANRTTGDVTISPVVNGVAQTLDGGAVCKLDATNTRRHGVVVTRGNGEDFAAGNRIALQAVSSGWAPTTANLSAWMMVRFDVGV